MKEKAAELANSIKSAEPRTAEHNELRIQALDMIDDARKKLSAGDYLDVKRMLLDAMRVGV